MHKYFWPCWELPECPVQLPLFQQYKRNSGVVGEADMCTQWTACDSCTRKTPVKVVTFNGRRQNLSKRTTCTLNKAVSYTSILHGVHKITPWSFSLKKLLSSTVPSKMCKQLPKSARLPHCITTEQNNLRCSYIATRHSCFEKKKKKRGVW